MNPDTLSVILRSASFIALFQAVGMALFLVGFGRWLERSSVLVERIARGVALAAAAFLVGQYALEAPRMAGDLSGIVDPSLQLLVLQSASSVVLACRLLGLIVIGMAVGRKERVGLVASALGTGCVMVSFMLTGHTAANALRWVLAPLLTLHVTILAFWFGALVPLYVISSRETPVVAARVTAAFSRVALWLVPGILVAGVSMGFVLVRDLAEWRSGYGLSLIAKFCGFLMLMGLAALNKWRLGPALAAGDGHAQQAFRRSLVAEYLLIAGVLTVTAVMTTLFSPGEGSG